MTPKRRALNLSVIFACLCFSKSLLIKSEKSSVGKHMKCEPSIGSVENYLSKRD